MNECLYGKEKTTSMLTANTLIPFSMLSVTINYAATKTKENRIYRHMIRVACSMGEKNVYLYGCTEFGS